MQNVASAALQLQHWSQFSNNRSPDIPNGICVYTVSVHSSMDMMHSKSWGYLSTNGITEAALTHTTEQQKQIDLINSLSLTTSGASGQVSYFGNCSTASGNGIFTWMAWCKQKVRLAPSKISCLRPVDIAFVLSIISFKPTYPISENLTNLHIHKSCMCPVV